MHKPGIRSDSQALDGGVDSLGGVFLRAFCQRRKSGQLLASSERDTRLRRTVEREHLYIRTPPEAPLGDEEDGLASARVLGEKGANELLVVAFAVDVGCVEGGAALLKEDCQPLSLRRPYPILHASSGSKP